MLRSVFFFFSSRRRHTRWPRDWSSDVCSSDLSCAPPPGSAVSYTGSVIRTRLTAHTTLLSANVTTLTGSRSSAYPSSAPGGPLHEHPPAGHQAPAIAGPRARGPGGDPRAQEEPEPRALEPGEPRRAAHREPEDGYADEHQRDPGDAEHHEDDDGDTGCQPDEQPGQVVDIGEPGAWRHQV